MSWQVPESFAEVRRLYRGPLTDALRYFLENDREAATVAERALEQAGRQWAALEGEANVLVLLAQAAADQCARLLPRLPWNRARRVPVQADLVRHLETHRFEKRVEHLRQAIAARRASALEDGFASGVANADEEERRVERLVQQFYERRMPMDDGDHWQDGGAACPVSPPPPVRDPGGGRTFAEALSPARNP